MKAYLANPNIQPAKLLKLVQVAPQNIKVDDI